MIQAIIFDLDNCLAAADEAGELLFAPAFAAIQKASQGTVPEELLKLAFADCWRHPLDWVASRHGFSAEMLAAGWAEFSTTEVTRPLHGYGDLATLAELPVQRFLVTSGFRRLQQSKIQALGLEPWFTAIYIDALGEPDRKGKQGYFEQILATGQFRPQEVLVVGDSQDSEIAAGNRLGIRTVQTLRPGVSRAANATFHIASLDELKKLIDQLDG